MPTIKDVVVRKPSKEEEKKCKTWPIWTCKPSEVFNELYSAQYGLTQENGKVCDWSIYGTGGTTHGFVEVGQDWVELTT